MGCCCCRLSVYAEDPDNYDNFSTAGFAPTANAPEITFELRFGSHGTIDMWLRVDSDAAGEQWFADVEIRENDGAGAIVHSPGFGDGGAQRVYTGATGAAEGVYGARPLEKLGLSPGTYWAQLQVNTTGTNVDIFHQWIRFGP